MGMGSKKSRRILCFACAIFSTNGAGAEKMNAAQHPANRFIRQNQDVDILNHWKTQINAQFIGFTEDGAKYATLTQFLSLADAAGVDARIIGMESRIFDEENGVSENVNVVYLTYDKAVQVSLEQGGEDVFTQVAKVSSASGGLKELFLEGFGPISDGCTVKTIGTTQNQIEAAVVAMSRDLDDRQKIECALISTPVIFGVLPIRNEYNYGNTKNESSEIRPAIFADCSEINLALMSASFCRETWKDYTAGCAFQVLQQAFKMHGEIYDIFSEEIK
jgi:hypothetical protein